MIKPNQNENINHIHFQDPKLQNSFLSEATESSNNTHSNISSSDNNN